MCEGAAHIYVFDFWEQFCFFGCRCFKFTYIFVERLRNGVPCHIKKSESQLPVTCITFIECCCFPDLLYYFKRDLFACFVMNSPCIKPLLFKSPVLHKL